MLIAIMDTDEFLTVTSTIDKINAALYSMSWYTGNSTSNLRMLVITQVKYKEGYCR